jgi:hypothetical protein
MEKSYRQVSLKEAARILYLTKQDELAEIVKKVNQNLFSRLNSIVFFNFSMDGN